MVSPPCTPAKSSSAVVHPLNSETPLQIKDSGIAATSPAYVGIDAKRKNTLLDLGESVPQVPTQFFTDANGILPPLKAGINIQKVVMNLKKKRAIQNGRWSRYTANPSTSPNIENVVFRGLQDIVKDIRLASGIKPSPTFSFSCNPNMSPHSSTRVDNRTRPDGYCIVAGPNINPKRGERPCWHEVAVPAEFKKSPKDDQDVDNWSKIIWSMSHIMQEDARRRFVIAFSIEDTDMRMWLASRSEVLVSLPFNWITKCDLTVEFFLRLLYAQPAELGWDPTMERLSPRDHTGDVKYLIECAGIKYRTERLISDIGTEAIRGRGTRVWEVREMKDNGKFDSTPLVLKDSWVDSGREREGAILSSIRKAAKERGKDVYDVDMYLMNAKAYSDVYIGGSKDDTHLLIRGRPSLEGMEAKLLVIKAKTARGPQLRSNAGATGALKLPGNDAPKLLEYSAKIHHRIVFTEVGVSIAEVSSLATALSALSDVAKALYTLHRCGWVHRDISVGNILVVNGVGKLTDVEYAKEESTMESHSGVRTGTLFFMSIEVEKQRYIYDAATADFPDKEAQTRSPSSSGLPTAVEEDAAIRAKILANVNNSSAAPSQPPASGPPPDETTVHKEASVPFKHNPLHDLEALVWVVIWLFVCSKFIQPAASQMSNEEWASTRASRAYFAKCLFREEGFRREAMLTKTALLDVFKTTLPELQRPAKDLSDVHLALLKQFVVVQKQREATKAQVPFANTIDPNLYASIVKFLQRAGLDISTRGDLKIDVSSWTQQQKRMREPELVEVDGATQSRKQRKTRHGQSATSVVPRSRSPVVTRSATLSRQ